MSMCEIIRSFISDNVLLYLINSKARAKNYLRNAKNTASRMQTNESMWLRRSVSVLKTSSANAVKTDKEITSCNIFNSKSENGPPFSRNPILFAGTWKQYSKNAMPQLMRMTIINGSALNFPKPCIFRWPYHARVMKMLEITRSAIVYTPVIRV